MSWEPVCNLIMQKILQQQRKAKCYFKAMLSIIQAGAVIAETFHSAFPLFMCHLQKQSQLHNKAEKTISKITVPVRTQSSGSLEIRDFLMLKSQCLVG